MSPLGDAIGPAPQKQIAAALEDALVRVVREQSDTAGLINQVLSQNAQILAKLTAVADQQQAATQSLAEAARMLAARTVTPAPEVTVTVQERELPEQDAPVVNVTVPEPVVNVTVQEPPEIERGSRKRVIRDAQGLISEIIEEPL